MNPAYKSALRAANLQYILIKKADEKTTEERKNTSEFVEAMQNAFGMNLACHLMDKLFKTYNYKVYDWLKYLDEQNTKIFLESDKFNFLN